MSKQKILGATDLRGEQVDVPEWDCSVWIGILSGQQRECFLAEWRKAERESGQAPADSALRFVLLTLRDESGHRLFADEERNLLAARSSVVIDRLAEVAMRINGLTDEAIKDAEKNSDDPQSAGSGSS